MALLEQASMYIHLDPRSDAVKVPAWFKKQAQLVLQVGLNMAVPIPDLHVDEAGLSCTLSFNRSPFSCMIPWPAVFALVGENGQAMVWAEDVPAEVAAQAQAQKAPEKPRSHLRSVGEGETAPAAKAEAPKSPSKKAVAGKAAAKASVAPIEGSRAAKAAPKTKASGKSGAKATPQKAAKIAAETKASAKKAVATPPAAKPEAALARQGQPAKKSAPRAPEASSEISKPKRELPPYLRVVK